MLATATAISDFCRRESKSPAPRERCPSPNAACFIILAALLLECGCLVLYVNLPIRLLKGSMTYAVLAKEIAEKGTITSSYRPPLYPIFLAATMRIGGPSWQTIAVATQAGLLIAVVAFSMAFTAHFSRSRTAAWLAGAFFASHILFTVEALTLRETIFFAFIEIIFLWILTNASFRGRFAVLGILIALAHFTRPTGFLLLIPAALAPGTDPAGKRMGKVKNVGLMLLFFVLTILPWQWRLYQLTGHLSLTSSTSPGLNLWKGNNPSFNVYFPYIEVDKYEPYVLKMMDVSDLMCPEADDYLLQSAKDFIFTSPVRTLANAFVKGLAFFSPIPVPFGTGDLVEREGSLQLDRFKPRKYWPLYTLHTACIYVGVCLCLFLPWKRGREERAYLKIALWLTLSTVAAYAVSFPETRFRLPLDPVFIIISAVGYSRTVGLKSITTRHEDAR